MPKYLPFLAFLFLGGIFLSSTVVSAQDTGRWTKGAPMLSERSEVAVAEVGAAAPAVQRRIVDLDPALTPETADHEDVPAHLGNRRLGALGQHRRAGGPPSRVLGRNDGAAQDYPAQK